MIPSGANWWPERSLGMLASATKADVRTRFNPHCVTRLQHRRVPRYPFGRRPAVGNMMRLTAPKGPRRAVVITSRRLLRQRAAAILGRRERLVAGNDGELF